MPTALPVKFFQMNVWDTDAKGTLLTSTPISRFSRVYRKMSCMEPFQHTIVAMLSDKLSSGIGKGNYYELSAGNTSPQTLWANGYVQRLTKSPAHTNEYQIDGASGLMYLSGFKDSGGQYMDPRIFWNLLEVINGVESSPGSGQYVPGSRGVLSASGWKAVWVDTSYTAAASTVTTIGTAPQFATTLTVASTAGFTAGHAVNIAGDVYHLASIGTDGSGHPTITIRAYVTPSAGYPVGTTVQDMGYGLPGQGDGWRTDWASAFLNLTLLAQHYNVYFREKAGSLAHNGTVEIGPLNDDSGLTVWGGDKLRADQAANHGLTLETGRPNAALAQQEGYALIEQASWQDDFSHVANLIWPLGSGNPDKGGITLQHLVGGDPFTATSGSPGSPINGWTAWQPYTGGKVYFVKANSKVTYQGNTFEFVAWERQDSGNPKHFQYGVVDRGPTPGSGPPPNGVVEANLIEKKILDSNWLLSAALGHLEYNSNPTPTYTFTVRHPLTSASGVPSVPKPGQAVTINYQGLVQSLDIDTNTASATYGQYIGTGTYTYLDYPGTADSNLIKKLKRCVTIEDEWSGKSYSQNLTMGRGKWHSKKWADKLAQQMEHHVQKHDQHHRHSWIKKPIDGITFLLSQGAPGASTGWAYDDPTVGGLMLQPAGIAVAAVADEQYFSDGHKLTLSVQLQDAAQYLDVWLCKAVDSTIKSVSSSRVYALFRLALSSSGQTTGFLTTTNGTTFTSRGTLYVSDIVDLSGHVSTGTYFVTIAWKSGIWQAWATGTPAQGTQEIARWHDTGGIISTYGSIGFALYGGSHTVVIDHMHAHPHHVAHPAKHGIGHGEIANNHPSKKHRDGIVVPPQAGGSQGGGTGVLGTKAQ